jgi:hypothetical protein
MALRGDILTVEQITELRLPTGYRVVHDPDPAEVVRTEIGRLEAELAMMREPSNEELIQMGRMSHPYFQIRMRLELLNTNNG